MFEVRLSTETDRFYQQVDVSFARRLNRCFARLEADPRTGKNVRSLKGRFAGLWRYRVGDWRVVYQIDDSSRIVHVVTIAHRSDVYDK